MVGRLVPGSGTASPTVEDVLIRIATSIIEVPAPSGHSHSLVVLVIVLVDVVVDVLLLVDVLLVVEVLVVVLVLVLELELVAVALPVVPVLVDVLVVVVVDVLVVVHCSQHCVTSHDKSVVAISSLTTVRKSSFGSAPTSGTAVRRKHQKSTPRAQLGESSVRFQN